MRFAEASNNENDKQFFLWKSRFAFNLSQPNELLESILRYLSDIDSTHPDFLEAHLLKTLGYALNTQLREFDCAIQMIHEIPIHQDSDREYVKGLKLFTLGIRELIYGNFPTAYKYLKESNSTLKDKKHLWLLLKSEINAGTTSLYLNNISEALDHYRNVIDYANAVQNPIIEFKGHLYLISTFLQVGMLKECLDHDKKYNPLEKCKTKDNVDEINYYFSMSQCNKFLGNFELSANQLKKAYDLAKTYADKQMLPPILSELAMFYFENGQLSLASKMINMALSFSENISTELLFIIGYRKSLIEQELKGEFIINEIEKNRLINLSQKLSFDLYLPETLFQIALVLMDLNIPELENHKKEILETYKKKFVDVDLGTLSAKPKLLQAMYCISTPTLENLVKGKEVVNQLISNNYEDIRIVKFLHLLKVRYLLKDYQFQPNEKTKLEILNFIEKMNQICKTYCSKQFQLHWFILLSQVHWLFMDAKSSIALLDKAIDLANKNGMKVQENLARKEKQKLLDELLKWDEVSESLKDELKKHKKKSLVQYTERVSKIVSQLWG